MRFKSELCACTHVKDEHRDGHRECTVEGCKCVAFDVMDGWDSDGNIDAETSEDSAR